MPLQFDIEKSIQWLLAYGSAPVRYLTQRDLLGASSASSAMKALWAEVEKEPEVEAIFASQQPDGSWFGHLPWAGKPKYRHRGKETYSPHSPKYVTTAWVLPVLGDMGFTVRDARVRRACDYMLDHGGRLRRPCDSMLPDGGEEDAVRKDRKRSVPEAPLYSCCGPAFLLTALAKVGFPEDEPLRKSYDLVTRLQREDGGWVNQHHKDATHAPYKAWDRSCPYATFRAANALFHARSTEYQPSLHRALRFLLWHLSIKQEAEIRQFYFHGHHILRELLMFAQMNEGMDAGPVQVICDWVMTLYHPEEGVFRAAGLPNASNARRLTGVSGQVLRYNYYHLVEDDWLTYYVLRIAAASGVGTTRSAESA
jgi:hypothetical protein